jgi:hypothetical protein
MSNKIHMLILIFSCFILITLVTFCKTSIFNPDLLECSDSVELIFHTGFNNATISPTSSSMDSITGVDTAFDSANDWDKLEDHENIGKVRINYEAGTKLQRYAIITNDPIDSSNNVLMFKIIEPHIVEGNKMKGRVNAYLFENNCLREIYQTVRIYFHPDMEYLKQWDEKFSWLTIFEFWNKDDNRMNWFRVTVGVTKESSGTVDALHFKVHGDKNNIFGKWKAVWEEIAIDFSIPFGEWMDVELYIKEGDENTGKFHLAITPSNGNKSCLTLPA